MLQRRLTQTLGKGGSEHSEMNLIVHHGVAEILDQVTKLLHILGAI